MITLNKKLEIIIPKQDNDGYEIDCLLLKRSIEGITEACGGVTITEGRGGWYSKEESRMMHDNVTIYEWYHDGEIAFDLSFWTSNIIEDLCSIYGQEAVSVKIDNVLYIIEKTDDKTETKEFLESLLAGN